MKNIATIFVLVSQFLFSQNLVATKLSQNAADFDQFVGTDEYDVPYFIKNNVLIKKTNDQIFEYKNLTLGKIYRVDLQNPLKILLFYKDFNVVTTVDNQLNETNIIDFNLQQTPILATATGMAAQNRFWLANAITQKIALFDSLNNKYTEITPAILSDTIQYYETDFNFFKFIDNKNQFICCDVFGKISSLPVDQEFDYISIINSNSIIYAKDNRLYCKNLQTSTTQEIDVAEKSIQNFCYKNQILTIFTNQNLVRYQLKLQ